MVSSLQAQIGKRRGTSADRGRLSLFQLCNYVKLISFITFFGVTIVCIASICVFLNPARKPYN